MKLAERSRTTRADPTLVVVTNVTSGAAVHNDKELEFCDKTIIVLANLIRVTKHDRLRGGGVLTKTPSLSVTALTAPH
eukprot:scaffold37165_cov89-Cyclotella_meneghiniana.AAC.8